MIASSIRQKAELGKGFMEIDWVEALHGKSPVDLVDAIYGNHHADFCDYRPFVSETGQVYCLTCESNVGTINDLSDVNCPRCGCFRTCHSGDTGECLQCGKECRCAC